MNEKFDVAVIGAGIGGLVCGCYLAKAGVKVLIAEQHSIPGGYCTSFKRKGFTFDVGVHYLGSLREEGILFKILNDLELLDKIEFITNDPTDRIITPDKTIFIRKDKLKTQEELTANFPHEKENINKFFDFLLEDNFLYIVSKTKRLNFKQLLDLFFVDYKLKAILAILLGNLGLPPSQISALASIVFLKEYIFDGGYYPRGGIQVLPNLLSKKFIEYGGKLLLSTKVEKIVTRQKKVLGIKLHNRESIEAKVVASNADATLTFEKLLDFKAKECETLKKLEVSPSAFIAYLGLKSKLNIDPPHYVTWLFSTYDIEKSYCGHLKNYDPQEKDFDYLLVSFPTLVDPSLAKKDKSIIRLLVGARYLRKGLWEKHREDIFQKMLKKLNSLLPNIQDDIEIKEMAGPPTLNRYTSNKNGSLFGWASTSSQIDKNVFPTLTSVENLYLTGHWVTNGAGQGGVSPSAFFGKITSRAILKNPIIINSK